MICLCCRQIMQTQWGICSVCRRLISPEIFYAELKNNNEWHSLCAVSLYEYPLNRLISRYKSQDKKEYAKALAHLLVYAWYFFAKQENLSPQAIITVPLSPKKYLMRRFNQTDLLGRYLAKWLNLPLLSRHLVRSESVFEQKILSKSKRQQNMQNAFSLVQKIPYSQVLLIDDIVTTGSTANAICSVLKQNGVKHIDLLCLARTL